MNLANVLSSLKLAADRRGVRFLVYGETPRDLSACDYPGHKHLTEPVIDFEAVFIDPARPAGEALSGFLRVSEAILQSIPIEHVRASFVQQLECELAGNRAR